MANHEDRPIRDTIHLLLAFRRRKNNPDLTNECIRVVISDYNLDLFLLKEKCKKLGGTWRIHHTVNARDTKKARIWILHKLIETSQFDGCIDSIWKTALLQSECKAENNFMFDVDTKDNNELIQVLDLIPDKIKIGITKTPNGHHIITKSFDSRKVLELSYVTLVRDGYYFLEEIK